ncbi:MAG: SHOCT domain-containing protein [Gammaproteobacteria bacterium]|jgi:putative membrane protein|nr:SHOCT domain-containing protein [Gammaproteobacteria bacterium]MBU2181265.1 SHOCT domain-containing protein [Gammaproteobacteria bacterium]MBU2223243.1 SHOCT domain-containing protein [Gammaproteobacteria bacterium]MBU2280354.1 SHOCT domain-containing protein [Gammaproteobacteria bacterium]MBU2426702.1 SHOCT domain-containing protein [Gammaproteobacteria bacterium]
MHYAYWNDWYSGWGWFLWFAVWILLISSIGHLGYSYRTHRRHFSKRNHTAVDLLKERYARGDISREEFERIKQELNQ